MLMGDRRAGDDRGETLLELVIAIVILGLCIVAVGAGITLSIKISRIHRAQAIAQAALHTLAEQTQYLPCSGSTPDYGTALNNYATNVLHLSNFQPVDARVAIWDPAAATPAFTPMNSGQSCPATDPGLQRITLTLNSTDGFVKESVVTIVRSAT